MFCKSCGKEVKDEAVICPYCGCALAKIAVNGETEKPEEKRKINVLCLVGFILSALSWLLFFLLNGIARVVSFSRGIVCLFFSIIGIVGLILSIIGVVQSNRKNGRLKSLGVAGISAAACMLINIIDYLSYLFL